MRKSAEGALAFKARSDEHIVILQYCVRNLRPVSNSAIAEAREYENAGSALRDTSLSWVPEIAIRASDYDVVDLSCIPQSLHALCTP